MPRRKVPALIQCPYHVTARCQNREWFDLPLSTVWAIMEDYLYLVAQGFNLRIHSFVLMANHFHLLVSAPDVNLGPALCYFMRESSREILRHSGRINHVWGGRNHKTLVPAYHYFVNTYKYVYQNPVRAGACERVEAYPYSTLHGLLGLSRQIVPMVEDTLLFSPGFDQSVLDWLNIKTSPELDDEMRRALRRPIFELATSRLTGRPSLLTQTRL